MAFRFSEKMRTVETNGGQHLYVATDIEISAEGHVHISRVSPQRRMSTMILEVKQILSNTFLPSGYPHSVRPEYLQYQIWDSIQGLSSYLRSVLTTRNVLAGVGVGSTEITPLSAALAWVFKDGVGMVGSLCFAYQFADVFETNTKEWRLLADVLNNLGLTLDLVSNRFPYPVFMVCTTVSVLSKSCCGLVAGATKARISAHFAMEGHLADVTAKESTQETAVALTGLVLGMALTRLLGSNHSDLAAYLIFGVLLVLHQYANYRLIRVLVLNSLNPQRCWLLAVHEVKTALNTPDDIAMSQLLSEQAASEKSVFRTRKAQNSTQRPHRKQSQKKVSEVEAALLTPSQVAEQESIFRPIYLSQYGPQLGVSMASLVTVLNQIETRLCSKGLSSRPTLPILANSSNTNQTTHYNSDFSDSRDNVLTPEVKSSSSSLSTKRRKSLRSATKSKESIADRIEFTNDANVSSPTPTSLKKTAPVEYFANTSSSILSDNNNDKMNLKSTYTADYMRKLADLWKGEPFFIGFDDHGRVGIALEEGISGEGLLKAYMLACYISNLLEIGEKEPSTGSGDRIFCNNKSNYSNELSSSSEWGISRETTSDDFCSRALCVVWETCTGHLSVHTLRWIYHRYELLISEYAAIAKHWYATRLMTPPRSLVSTSPSMVIIADDVRHHEDKDDSSRSNNDNSPLSAAGWDTSPLSGILLTPTSNARQWRYQYQYDDYENSNNRKDK